MISVLFKNSKLFPFLSKIIKHGKEIILYLFINFCFISDSNGIIKHDKFENFESVLSYSFFSSSHIHIINLSISSFCVTVSNILLNNSIIFLNKNKLLLNY